MKCDKVRNRLRPSGIACRRAEESEPTCFSSASDDYGGFKSAVREQLKKR
jgi:hypothetical protein